MDSRDIDQLKTALNADVVRRLLIKYFIDKGFTDSFDRLVYPPSIQDLPIHIPQLATKVEVVPHAVAIDPVDMQQARLGWNLFVLGSYRMYLGESQHYDLASLARQISTGQVAADSRQIASFQTTPRKIINFITATLKKNRAGYVDFQAPVRPSLPQVFGSHHGAGLQGQMFKTSGSALR